MNVRIWVNIGGIALLSVAATAAALDTVRQDNLPELLVRPSLRSEPDPLRTEQRRCQLKGQAAAGDVACLETWALTRERFLRPRSSIEPPFHEAR